MSDAEGTWGIADGTPFVGWADDPDNYCVGCSAANPMALGLRFVHRAGGVEARTTAARELNGAPGVVHGGMQAVMLDEAMGHAIRAALDDVWPVTVDLRLRYRRPVHVEVPLLVRAVVVGRDGRSVHVEGTILAVQEGSDGQQGQGGQGGPDGQGGSEGTEEIVLTRATAEFRLLDPSARPTR